MSDVVQCHRRGSKCMSFLERTNPISMLSTGALIPREQWYPSAISAVFAISAASAAFTALTIILTVHDSSANEISHITSTASSSASGTEDDSGKPFTIATQIPATAVVPHSPLLAEPPRFLFRRSTLPQTNWARLLLRPWYRHTVGPSGFFCLFSCLHLLTVDGCHS